MFYTTAFSLSAETPDLCSGSGDAKKQTNVYLSHTLMQYEKEIVYKFFTEFFK